MLENQGLRPTTRGGHLAVYDATRAQLDPPMGQALRPFDRMHRQRHDVECPPTDAPQLTADHVREDVTKAAAIVDLGERVLDQMSLGRAGRRRPATPAGTLPSRDQMNKLAVP